MSLKPFIPSWVHIFGHSNPPSIRSLISEELGIRSEIWMPHTKCQRIFVIGCCLAIVLRVRVGQVNHSSTCWYWNKPIGVDVHPTIQLRMIILGSRLNSHSQVILADRGILVDREILEDREIFLDQAIQHDFADFWAPLLYPEIIVTIPLASLFLFQSMQAACLAKDSTPKV